MGIVHQKSCPYTPQQSGVAKRKHRHIVEVTRVLRFQAKIPLFWHQCVLAVVNRINRIPSGVINNQTPFERLYSTKPTLTHLRVLGCLCYAKKLTEHDKMLPRSRAAVLVGYSEVPKGFV